MSRSANFFCSTVGKKYLMGISGAVWALFVVAHLSGNLLIFAGPEAFNSYGHMLTSNHLIWVARAGLLAALILHVYLAINLTIENRKSRGSQGYAVHPNGKKGATLASRTMVIQGSLILAFVIYHIMTFSAGKYYETQYHGEAMRDIYRLVIEVFHQPAYVVWYVICLILLGVHLSHGVMSVFQSLGFRKDGYAMLIKKLSMAYALVVSAGFISLPIYVYLFAQ